MNGERQQRQKTPTDLGLGLSGNRHPPPRTLSPPARPTVTNSTLLQLPLCDRTLVAAAAAAVEWVSRAPKNGAAIPGREWFGVGQNHMWGHLCVRP